MFTKILSPKTKNILALLAKQKFIKDFYLAGGTALALQIGHRTSIDLDFFTSEKFEPKQIIQELSKLGKFVLETESWGTIIGQLNNVKIDFLYFQHKLLKPSKKLFNIKLANPIDIALMKIPAIGSRGSKKDFIDLYFVTKNIMSLKQLFKLLPKKFKKVDYESYHLIRGLTYFKDADKQPMPKMFCQANWQKIKKYFQKQAITLI